MLRCLRYQFDSSFPRPVASGASSSTPSGEAHNQHQPPLILLSSPLRYWTTEKGCCIDKHRLPDRKVCSHVLDLDHRSPCPPITIVIWSMSVARTASVSDEQFWGLDVSHVAQTLGEYRQGGEHHGSSSIRVIRARQSLVINILPLLMSLLHPPVQTRTSYPKPARPASRLDLQPAQWQFRPSSNMS